MSTITGARVTGQVILVRVPAPRIECGDQADVFAKAVKCVAAKAETARRTDLERLEFHDLRHTFASLMIAARANPLQLAEALGHTDGPDGLTRRLVWKRYVHLYPGSTREAAAALDRHLTAVAS
jgi:integrase